MTYSLGKQNVLLKISMRIFSIGLLPVLTADPVLGAERIKFNYGVLERSIPINSLEIYVTEQPSYLPYLSSDYVNTISQQPLPLSLIKSLTFEQLQQATSG